MEHTVPQLTFDFYRDLPVVTTFDAPETSSDGGLLLLRSVDDCIGLSRWFAQCVPDKRNKKFVQHHRIEQVRQRVYQIALGYEDCNDATSLRADPLFKTVCERAPDDEQGLSSQPTLSRLENAVDMRAVCTLLLAFERTYVESLPADTTLVILDIDSTDDETHGHQQLSFFHGYYDHYMYHHLLVFDGEGRLVTVLLRPGNTHASRGAAPLVARVIRAIKTRFPQAQIVVRGDSGFCVPRFIETIEALDRELGEVYYIFGCAKNPVLLRLAQPLIKLAEESYKVQHHKVRLFGDFEYAAETWPHTRHVIAKAEHSDKGANPRFVVTSIDGFEARDLYDAAYCARGQCENNIKDLKNALRSDRLSCETFVANFFRLLLHAAAYRLMYSIRERAACARPELARTQFDTLRLRLLKVAAHVTRSVRRILVRLPLAFSWANVFARVALSTA